MPCYQFDGIIPVVDPAAFVHPTAVLIGEVLIGARVYVGPGAVLRGDWGRVIVEDGSNVQENCVLHMFPGLSVHLEPNAHIGHGAIVHGARIGRNSLVGMNAVVMDRAHIGAESIVGALSFVAQDSQYPERSLIAGNPAKRIKTLDDETVDWKTAGTELYQQLPASWTDAAKQGSANEVQPLSEPRAQLRAGLWRDVALAPKS